MTEKNNLSPTPASQDTMMQLIMGGAVTQFIGTAVKLGIPDVLKQGAVSAEEVAEQCNLRAGETYRFLRGLSVIGVVAELEQKKFSLTPVGQWLRSDIPGSFKPLAMMHSGIWSSQTYANLDHTLKTGESAFQKTFGCHMFEWLSENPDIGELFGRAMSTYSGMEIALVVDTYDFSGANCIVDVGGSHGDLLSMILANTPDVRGILFDMPAVVEEAKSYVSNDIAQRIDFVGGSFFETVPTGGDIYMLKHILHDWNNAKAANILQNVVNAMSPGGRVLVIEQGITPPGVPGPGKMLDLSMMILTEGGMERTSEQHRELFENAGLKYVQTIQTKGSVAIFEAVYPD